MTPDFIRTSYTAYDIMPEDSAITLALDRTEPPIPYQCTLSEHNEAGCFRYPSAKALEAKLASRFQVNAENVIITAGADEALDRVCRAFLTFGDEVVTTRPVFEMIPKYVELTGATIQDVLWLNGEFPIDRVASRISRYTRMVVLVSPNNPTGQTIPMEMVATIANQYKGTLFVLDFAYVEFSDGDPTQLLLTFSNILIVRSFSKAWGLPGLRVGYAIGQDYLIRAIRSVGGPYSVAAPSIELVNSNLERFEQEMRMYAERIKWERTILQEWLRDVGTKFIPSKSNFILLFCSDPTRFDATLHSFGIRARSFPSLSGARRLTLPGNAESFDRLQIAIKNIF